MSCKLSYYVEEKLKKKKKMKPTWENAVHVKGRIAAPKLYDEHLE
jgi:hypothetical protein